MTNQTEAYCVKCKTKREVKNPVEVIFKGKGGKDRKMLKGECPICGTKMCRILSSKETKIPQDIEEQKIEATIDPSIEKETDEWDKIT
jgi:hypothetical protein